MKKLIIAFCALALVSCGSTESEDKNDKKEEILEEEVVIVTENNENEIDTTTIKTPSSVVTQEHWEHFQTDIKGVIYFTKTDSTFSENQNLVATIKDKLKGIANYKMYTNDNYAQIFLNDTLAFDISPFLLEHKNGFVLLKPQSIPTYQSVDEDEKVVIENVISFFKS